MPEAKSAEIARQWWARAQEDMKVARRVVDVASACSFHAQQAVEKAIKGLLVSQQVEFTTTHNIQVLLELLEATAFAPETSVTEDLETLTRYAVTTRYPPDAPSPEEATVALALAGRFLAWAQRHFDATPDEQDSGNVAPSSST